MLAGVAVVAAGEVAHQVALELPAQDVPNDMLPAARVIFVVADGVLAGGAKRPDVAVLAVLPLPRLVAVQHGTGAGLLFERIDLGLERAPHLMQQFDDFARADCLLMQRAQVGLDPPYGRL